MRLFCICAVCRHYRMLDDQLKLEVDIDSIQVLEVLS